MRINGYTITPDYECIDEFASLIARGTLLFWLGILIGIVLPYALGRLFFLLIEITPQKTMLGPEAQFLAVGWGLLIIIVFFAGIIQTMIAVEKTQ